MDAKVTIKVDDKVSLKTGYLFPGGAKTLTVMYVDKDGRAFLSNGYLYNPESLNVVGTTQTENPSTSDGGSSDYYKLPEDITDLQDLIEHQEMNFAMGNIFKAAWRLGKKAGNDASYDLKKIIWFAERELARIQ